MQLPFGEWLPDQPEHLNPGANVAKNVYYALQGYKPFKSLVSYSSNAMAQTLGVLVHSETILILFIILLQLTLIFIN